MIYLRDNYLETFHFAIFEKRVVGEPAHQIYENQCSIAAGISAVKTLSTGLYDEQFDPNNINYDFTDDGVDSYTVNSSFWAAVAYAGLTWEADSDAAKRLPPATIISTLH